MCKKKSIRTKLPTFIGRNYLPCLHLVTLFVSRISGYNILSNNIQERPVAKLYSFTKQRPTFVRKKKEKRKEKEN
jgi:hypothetical protein